MGCLFLRSSLGYVDWDGPAWALAGNYQLCWCGADATLSSCRSPAATWTFHESGPQSTRPRISWCLSAAWFLPGQQCCHWQLKSFAASACDSARSSALKAQPSAQRSTACRYNATDQQNRTGLGRVRHAGSFGYAAARRLRLLGSMLTEASGSVASVDGRPTLRLG